jgi:hypothetical protein
MRVAVFDFFVSQEGAFFDEDLDDFGVGFADVKPGEIGGAFGKAAVAHHRV